MIHPATELRYIDDSIGWGVFALEKIPCGTITWARDPFDRILDADFKRRLPPAYAPLVSHFTFPVENGEHLFCWDWARYVNHSCKPTCGGTDQGFEVALTDISPPVTSSPSWAPSTGKRLRLLRTAGPCRSRWPFSCRTAG